MFKIAGLTDTERFNGIDLTGGMSNWLMPYGLVEEWSGNLGSGVLKLSASAASLHGLSCSECGLLTVTRRYDQRDRSSVLELFEKAATKASSFCFSTTIICETQPQISRPVFCMGRSIDSGKTCPDSIVGIFIFPNVH
ncbi:hypothetical protein BJF95_02750 [Rhizobium oryziradicis]|uniref:Uncharacterized protein n=2 Tax=Rhizobium oryziradicis TaxID=1867956 RepID=A0A1Q8ZVK2_9HYPH|nr:hypothetical protein BJF95_02750 [Rhizobium oryziradicis]